MRNVWQIADKNILNTDLATSWGKIRPEEMHG